MRRRTENAAVVSRRDFLEAAVGSMALAVVGTRASTAAKPDGTPQLVDVNVNLSRWPLRRVRFDDTAGVAAMLRSQGATQAWAGSFDALLHKDVAAVNAQLVDECRRYGRGLLLPFGTVNPKAPGWEADLRRCTEEHHMPGIRLHPNYHGYKLDEPDCARLLKLAAERGLVVQLVLLMEDERMMHPLLRTEPVDTAPLADLVKRTPGLRLVLLNALGKLHGQALTDVVVAGAVYVEISMLEGVGGLANLLAQVPPERVLFGSYTPLFYFESALLKLKESPLAPEPLAGISHGNIRRLLATAKP